MAEVDRYLFDFKELAEAFIKKLDLHEGLWGVSIEFGLAATNIPTGPDGKTITPAAISLVQKIGIQRFPEANNLTVDAAEVNPAPKAAKKEAGKKTAK
jgi:hypothetical protein